MIGYEIRAISVKILCDSYSYCVLSTPYNIQITPSKTTNKLNISTIVTFSLKIITAIRNTTNGVSAVTIPTVETEYAVIAL